MWSTLSPVQKEYLWTYVMYVLTSETDSFNTHAWVQWRIQRGIWVFEHPPQHPAYLMWLTVTEALVQAAPGCVTAGKGRSKIAKSAPARARSHNQGMCLLCMCQVANNDPPSPMHRIETTPIYNQRMRRRILKICACAEHLLSQILEMQLECTLWL